MPSNLEVADYELPCEICGTPMPGITSYDLRKRCEACGGNETEYNGENPHPECYAIRGY